MAGEETANKPSVETEVVRGDTVTSMSVEVGGDNNKKAATRTSEATSFEATSGDDLPLEDELEGELGDDGDKEKQPETTDEDKEKGEPEVDASEDLGEYNPEDTTKFDERYFKDGKLDQKALSAEFWSNFGKAEDKAAASLNPNTLAYLEDRLGLTKEFIKDTCDALVLKAEAGSNKVYERVGGKESYDAMVSWGREGGYTPAQVERFNKALNAGGADLEDALDALAARYAKANPEGAAQIKGPKGPPKGRTHRSSPERSATQRAAPGAAAGGDTFATKADYSAAWDAGLAKRAEARASGDRKAISDAESHLAFLQRKARRSTNMK